MVGTNNEKSFWKSKTVWGSIFLAVIGAVAVYKEGALSEELIQALMALAAAFGLYGLRDAQ